MVIKTSHILVFIAMNSYKLYDFIEGARWHNWQQPYKTKQSIILLFILWFPSWRLLMILHNRSACQARGKSVLITTEMYPLFCFCSWYWQSLIFVYGNMHLWVFLLPLWDLVALNLAISGAKVLQKHTDDFWSPGTWAGSKISSFHSLVPRN